MIEESPRPNSVSSAASQGSIKVASLLGNTELNYGELDSSTKESILTELLVKSAITQAIKRQKVGYLIVHFDYKDIIILIYQKFLKPCVVNQWIFVWFVYV